MHSTADCGPSAHTIWVDPTVIKDITDIHRANTHCSPDAASMWYTHTDPHKQSRTQSHTTVQPHHARSSKQTRGSPKIYPSAYSPITPHCSEHTEHQLLPGLNLAVKTVTQSVTKLVPVEHPNEYTYSHCLHCCHGNLVDTPSALCPHRGSLSCLNGRHSNSECMSVWLQIRITHDPEQCHLWWQEIQLLQWFWSSCTLPIASSNVIKRGLLHWRSQEKGWVLWFQRVKDRYVLMTFRSEWSDLLQGEDEARIETLVII